MLLLGNFSSLIKNIKGGSCNFIRRLQCSKGRTTWKKRFKQGYIAITVPSLYMGHYLRKGNYFAFCFGIKPRTKKLVYRRKTQSLETDFSINCSRGFYRRRFGQTTRLIGRARDLNSDRRKGKTARILNMSTKTILILAIGLEFAFIYGRKRRRNFSNWLTRLRRNALRVPQGKQNCPCAWFSNPSIRRPLPTKNKCYIHSLLRQKHRRQWTNNLRRLSWKPNQRPKKRTPTKQSLKTRPT